MNGAGDDGASAAILSSCRVDPEGAIITSLFGVGRLINVLVGRTRRDLGRVEAGDVGAAKIGRCSFWCGCGLSGLALTSCEKRRATYGNGAQEGGAFEKLPA